MLVHQHHSFLTPAYNETTSSLLRIDFILVQWFIGYFLDPPLPLHDHNHQHVCLLQHPILLLFLQ